MNREGLNNKNFNQWREYFIKCDYSEVIAKLKAENVCHRQELEILKKRIIKLEKKL